jgi:YD repeat-containing protein
VYELQKDGSWNVNGLQVSLKSVDVTSQGGIVTQMESGDIVTHNLDNTYTTVLPDHTSYTNLESGRNTDVTDATGKTRHLEYDTNGRLARMTETAPGGEPRELVRTQNGKLEVLHGNKWVPATGNPAPYSDGNIYIPTSDGKVAWTRDGKLAGDIAKPPDAEVDHGPDNQPIRVKIDGVEYKKKGDGWTRDGKPSIFNKIEETYDGGIKFTRSNPNITHTYNVDGSRTTTHEDGTSFTGRKSDANDSGYSLVTEVKDQYGRITQEVEYGPDKQPIRVKIDGHEYKKEGDGWTSDGKPSIFSKIERTPEGGIKFIRSDLNITHTYNPDGSRTTTREDGTSYTGRKRSPDDLAYSLETK